MNQSQQTNPSFSPRIFSNIFMLLNFLDPFLYSFVSFYIVTPAFNCTMRFSNFLYSFFTNVFPRRIKGFPLYCFIFFYCFLKWYWLLWPWNCWPWFKRVSKAEKLQLHCCGTDKIKLFKLLPFARLTSALCYLCPGAFYKTAKLLKH